MERDYMQRRPIKSSPKLKIILALLLAILLIVLSIGTNDVFQSYLILGSAVIIGAYLSHQHIKQNQQDEQN